MQKRLLLVLTVLGLFLGAAGDARADRTESFVQRMFRRFAYRPATPQELGYWSGVVEQMAPERAEKRLRNWFFVHAAYKTTLGRTVTIFDVSRIVDRLDSGELDFHAVQYALFHSEAYRRAKRQGRAGTMMVPLPSDPS